MAHTGGRVSTKYCCYLFLVIPLEHLFEMIFFLWWRWWWWFVWGYFVCDLLWQRQQRDTTHIQTRRVIFDDARPLGWWFFVKILHRLNRYHDAMAKTRVPPYIIFSRSIGDCARILCRHMHCICVCSVPRVYNIRPQSCIYTCLLNDSAAAVRVFMVVNTCGNIGTFLCHETGWFCHVRLKCSNILRWKRVWVMCKLYLNFVKNISEIRWVLSERFISSLCNFCI